MIPSATFAESVITFNRQLNFNEPLSENFDVINPFQENPEAVAIMEKFYRKFYNDNKLRKFLIGINPGRFGAGTTGVPFTDTKRLIADCKINTNLKTTHEPSAVFIYDMIYKYGGLKKFYNDVYINSIFPLTIIRKNSRNNWVNCNYYDDKTLEKQVETFAITHLKQQIAFGIDTKKVFVLGKKNAIFLNKTNQKEQLFKQIVSLEHPRYIQQYKSKNKDQYINKYIEQITFRNDK